MKTTKPLLLALAALSTLAAHSDAQGSGAAAQTIAVSESSVAIGGVDSEDASKEAKIAALESRLAELEARAEAYHAKIAAIEKRVYPRAGITAPKGRGPNARR